jgi:hypothetical protein
MSYIQPPNPVVLNGLGVIRFAAGSESGPRSCTWRVEGVSNTYGRDDIYVGTRQTMKAVKISLHDANPSRGQQPATILAFDKPFADANGIKPRRLVHMGQTAPVAPGWRHELTIATPSTTFGTFPETPPLKRGETIQWWTPPPHPEQLSFQLYVGDVVCAKLTLSNHIGDVCQMQLSHGRRLWIVAQCEPMPDAVGQAIEERVASLSKQPNVIHPFTLFKQGDGVPVLLDLAVIYRPA